MTATEFLNSYKRAVERIKARHAKLTPGQKKRSILRKAGEHTAQVKTDYLVWSMERWVRLGEIHPRREPTLVGQDAEQLYRKGTIHMKADKDAVLWAYPRLCNGLLPKFLAGKITAAEAIEQEEASCAKAKVDESREAQAQDRQS